MGQVPVCQSPILRLRVTEENGRVILDTPERVRIVDLLGHIDGLRKGNSSYPRVIGEICHLAHVGRLDDRAIFAE